MYRATLAAGLLLVLASFAQAAPSSIGDCEKIADPDGYNRCLAQFGPAARGGRVAQPEPANADVPKVFRAKGGGGRYARRGWRGGKAYAKSGRQRMTISIGGGSRATARRGRRR